MVFRDDLARLTAFIPCVDTVSKYRCLRICRKLQQPAEWGFLNFFCKNGSLTQNVFDDMMARRLLWLLLASQQLSSTFTWQKKWGFSDSANLS